MKIKKKFGPLYRDATMLMRPKTGLKDMTIEANKGTASAGVLPDGATLPASQTAPDANLDELLASLDADTRDYLQLLINSAGTALDGRGIELSQALRRFDPTTRDFELIGRALRTRNVDIATVTHNLAILTQAIGTQDNELANLVRASNAVFQTFAQQNANVSATVAKLPGAFSQIDTTLGKLTTTAQLSQKALTGLQPSANALAGAERANQAFFRATTPIIRNQIRPFVKAANPTVAALVPAATSLNQASPNLTTTFKVLGTFLNELAYNPGSPRNPGYLFYLAWANHNLNSALSAGDASGALLHSMFLFAPAGIGILCGSGEQNPLIGSSVNQLNFPGCNTSGTTGPTGPTGASGSGG
jgi:phospholipid/cholesterol/gamma-HCH transport system substrate-binding protein